MIFCNKRLFWSNSCSWYILGGQKFTTLPAFVGSIFSPPRINFIPQGIKWPDQKKGHRKGVLSTQSDSHEKHFSDTYIPFLHFLNWGVHRIWLHTYNPNIRREKYLHCKRQICQAIIYLRSPLYSTQQTIQTQERNDITVIGYINMRYDHGNSARL